MGRRAMRARIFGSDCIVFVVVVVVVASHGDGEVKLCQAPNLDP
jgi:hypothetical protein